MGLVTPTEPVPLDELGRVHFVGIGGAGMSGIARIMLARGTKVSGSDSGASATLDELAALGARVHVGHAVGQVGDADTVVVLSAIRDSNPELAEARRRNLRVLHRAAALASLMHGRRGCAGRNRAAGEPVHPAGRQASGAASTAVPHPAS